MQIKAFRLRNIGRFQSLELSLLRPNGAPAHAVALVGNNGAGKTSILKSLSISLGWFVARLRADKGNGSSLKEDSINNAASFAAIDIEVIDDGLDAPEDRCFSWTLTRTRPGQIAPENSQLAELTRLASHYRSALTEHEQFNLPLVAYYPVERSVLEVPLKARKRPTFQQLAGYDGTASDTANFETFFEWFREHEDVENELISHGREANPLFARFEELREAVSKDTTLSDEKRKQFTETIEQHYAELASMLIQRPRTVAKLRLLPPDKQLNAVRQAIEHFMPGFSNLRVSRYPHLQMLVNKHDQILDVLQLSQGEKSLLALVGDIARRLSMLNPGLENPLEGRGIILIDEVDMHLHPKWQRTIVEQLNTTFPNCQFILTTHSPLVISDSKHLMVFSLDDGVLNEVSPQYGQDANSVLLDVMDTPIRNTEIERELNDVFDAIQDRKLEDAKAKIRHLETVLPISNLELNKAKLMLRKQELRVEKDQ